MKSMGRLCSGGEHAGGQEWGEMRVARGRGAAHAVEEDDGSARSFTTAGALREVVPPPYRLGVSNPDPYRLFADRGARLAVVFLIEDPGSR